MGRTGHDRLLHWLAWDALFSHVRTGDGDIFMVDLVRQCAR